MKSYNLWVQATRKQLATAATEAGPLVEQGRFDEAEKLVRAVDSDIYGAVALGDLFTRALDRAVRCPQPDRAHVHALYERALRWRCAWPGVHTQAEAEAEQAHADEVHQELAALLQLLPQAR